MADAQAAQISAQLEADHVAYMEAHKQRMEKMKSDAAEKDRIVKEQNAREIEDAEEKAAQQSAKSTADHNALI